MSTDDEQEIERFAGVVQRAFEGLDPVPEAEIERGRQIFALRSIDAELAELVSHDEDEELAGLRSDGAAIVMRTFASDELSIEVEVDPGSGGVSTIIGQLVPEVACPVTAEGPAGRQSVRSDEFGRFMITVSPGPIRLRIERPGQRVIISDVLMV